MSDLKSVSELVSELIPESVSSLTGYEVAKVASVVVGRYVREQLVYSYIRQNMIASVSIDGQKRVRRDVAIAWIAKYGSKHTVRTDLQK
jgi:hypothetical protein